MGPVKKRNKTKIGQLEQTYDVRIIFYFPRLCMNTIIVLFEKKLKLCRFRVIIYINSLVILLMSE